MKLFDFTEISYKYKNKWVVLNEKNDVVFSGDSIEEVYKKAKEDEKLFVTYIPDPDISIAL